jgi:hypothetical protein
MSPYAARCNWCGRSTTVSAFFQVATIGVLIAAALVVGGVMPVDAVTRYLPAGILKDSPLRQPAPESATGSGRGEAPGGYGRPESRSGSSDRRPSRADEEEARRRQASRRQRQVTGATDRCDSADRITSLANRYPWAASDLRLIACREVREGFTEDQLIASRGRPSRQVDSAGSEVWVYRDMRVVVQADRVIAIRNN